MLQAQSRPATRLDVPRPVVAGAACAALMAAVSWAVLAAGWVSSGGGGAVVVAMAASIEAALLAQARVARIVAIVVAPLLALAAIVPTTLGAMPFDGNAGAAHVIGRYLGALTSGLASTSDWSFTVGLCAILWLCGYWLGWLAIRERRGILAVIPLYAVLATNVLNTHAPDSVALPEALAAGLSLLVVAGAHLDSLQAAWSRERIPSLPGTRGRFALTVAVAAVALTLAAVLIPPATTTDISSVFFPGPGSNGHGAGVGSGTGTIEFSTGTVPGGALVSQPQPVLTYSVDTTAPVYLQVVDDTQFIAGNWYPDQGGDAGTGPNLAFAGLQFTAGQIPRDLNPADGGAAAGQVAVHADITLQPGATGATSYVPFSGEPSGVDRNGVAFGIVAAAHPQSLLTVDYVQLDAGVSTQTTVHSTALISGATATQLRSAGTQYPEFTLPYTQLPDDDTRGAAKIAELAAQWTAGTTNPYDAAEAIQARLRDPRSFTYTLTPPSPPSGVWPVVYFLTQSHRGYCQYFASAMGAMLRSLDIPTRLVNGYGPGTTQAQSGRQGVRQQLVTTSDAHTWVEAYFPHYGWIPFEPTPPSSVGAYSPFPRGPAAVSGPPTPGASPVTPGSSLKPGFNEPGVSSGGLPPSARGASPWMVLGLVAAGLLVLLAAVVLWMLLPASLRGAWRRVEALGVMRGMRRRPGETHREYAERIAAVTPRASTAMRELATILGRSEFSPGGVDHASQRHAIRLWRRIFGSAPGALWSSRRRPAPV